MDLPKNRKKKIKHKKKEDDTEEGVMDTKIDITQIFYDLSKKNVYIQTTTSNKRRDPHSISSLIDISLSQSDCIKLGIGIERLLLDFITTNTNLINIKESNTKGVKEKDHLFKDCDNNIIYYAELKGNLNLDTEKCKATYIKCRLIEEELIETYLEHKIIVSLVGLRYFTTSIINKNIKKKYVPIKDNLCGVNEYFKLLGIKNEFDDENQYKKMLNNLAIEMFQ